VLAGVASLVCALLEKWAHRHYLAEDPREVVLDEVAGMALALAIAGPGFWTVAAAFFAFRFFDIFKPGIHWIEERGWPGTIVWDDLLAGVYAGGAVAVGARIIYFIFS
jgi:phosphatidylglycerophosphatase A